MSVNYKAYKNQFASMVLDEDSSFKSVLVKAEAHTDSLEASGQSLLANLLVLGHITYTEIMVERGLVEVEDDGNFTELGEV